MKIVEYNVYRACLIAYVRCICNWHVCIPLLPHAPRNDNGTDDSSELQNSQHRAKNYTYGGSRVGCIFWSLKGGQLAVQQTGVASLDEDWTTGKGAKTYVNLDKIQTTSSLFLSSWWFHERQGTWWGQTKYILACSPESTVNLFILAHVHANSNC